MISVKPLIPEPYIVRSAPRPLCDPIKPGQILAWEPDLPTARELVIVTKVRGDFVWVRNLDDKYGRSYMNDESRVREACWPTRFKDQEP